MSKKSIILIVVLLCALTVISFVNWIINNSLKNGRDNEKISFSATVLENNTTSLLVEPDKGEDELKSSDKIAVRVPENGAVLKDLSEFSIGSKVEIIYNGAIMESYPAQINAYEVKIK